MATRFTPASPSERFDASHPGTALFHNAVPHPDAVYQDLLPIADGEAVVLALNGGAVKVDPIALGWLENALGVHLSPEVLLGAGGGSGSMQKAREARGPAQTLVARKRPYAVQHAPLQPEWNVVELTTEEARLQLFAEAKVHLVFAGGTGTRLEQTAAEVEIQESNDGRVFLVDPDGASQGSWSAQVRQMVKPGKALSVISTENDLCALMDSLSSTPVRSRAATLEGASRGGEEALAAKAVMQRIGRPVIAMSGGTARHLQHQRRTAVDALDALCNISGYAALVDGDEPELAKTLSELVTPDRLIERVSSEAELDGRSHQYVASREWANHLAHLEVDAHVIVAGDLRAMRRAYAAVINSSKETGYPVPLVVVDAPGSTAADAFVATLKDAEREMVTIASTASDIVASIHKRHTHVLGGKLTRSKDLDVATDKLSLQLRTHPSPDQQEALRTALHTRWNSGVAFTRSTSGGSVMTMEFTDGAGKPLPLTAALEVEASVGSALGSSHFEPFTPGLVTFGSAVRYGAEIKTLPLAYAGRTRSGGRGMNICRALV